MLTSFFVVLLFKLAGRQAGWMAVRLALYAHKTNNKALWKFIAEGMRRAGRARARYLAKMLRVDPGDVSTFSRIQDWEDNIFGVEGTWTRKEKKIATKLETKCPFAEGGLKQCPEFCEKMVHAFEVETFRAINPSYRLKKLDSLLSKDDAHCEFTHEID